MLVSIPSVLDPSMAPEGCHSLHAYVPATEPYDLWKNLDRNSPEYAKFKEERSQVWCVPLCACTLGVDVCVCVYVMCAHTYIHTYIHLMPWKALERVTPDTCMHLYIHTHIHVCIHTFAGVVESCRESDSGYTAAM